MDEPTGHTLARGMLGMEAWGDITTRAEMEPLRRLSAAILGAAVHDWKKLRSCKEFWFPKEGEDGAVHVTRQSMYAFFRSDWYVDLCDACDLDPDLVLRKIGALKKKDEPYWEWKRRQKHGPRKHNKKQAGVRDGANDS
jgi:hypothetical protein